MMVIPRHGAGEEFMRIFAAETISQSPTWNQSTIPLRLLHEGDGPLRLLRAPYNTFITARSVSSDDVVIFTDEHPVSANLYSVRPYFGRARPTLIRTDPYFQMPQHSWRRRYLQLVEQRVDAFVVWAEATAERYHRFLGIPRAKMTAVRYHHTLNARGLVAASGDYLFSGGDSMRDYPMLLAAVRDLPIPVRIATHWRPPSGFFVPSNVRFETTDRSEFLTVLAGARLVVLPLRTDNLRTCGQQSYLNAMALGKAVVVTDPDDAAFYIEHGRTGMLTPAGEPEMLREAIVSLWDSPEKLRGMGEEARHVAMPLDQENTWRQVLAVALDAHQRRVGIETSPRPDQISQS
jgi:glycosyltransferase involved in cell wall biosynthesis